MAVQPHVAGAVPCYYGAEGAIFTSLFLLGYTRNSADVTKEASWINVPGDENGGDDGPPVDVIYLGEIARIRLELTKYDQTIADAARARLNSAVTGVPHVAGTLVFGGTQSQRLLLNGPNDPRNFPRCFVRNAIEIGRGSKYSTLIIELEAHKDDNGVLYNAVIT